MQRFNIYVFICVLLCISAYALPSAYPESNPYSATYHWTFDDTTQDSILGLNANLTGAAAYNTTIPLSSGKSIWSLGGAGDVIDMNTKNFKFNVPYSICFWFRFPSQAFATWGYDYYCGSANSGQVEFKFGHDNSTSYRYLTVSNRDADNTQNFYYDKDHVKDPFQGQAWSHICFVSTGSGFAYYINGTAVSIQPSVAGASNNPNLDIYFLGRNNNGAIDPLQGSVDDIVIWNETAIGGGTALTLYLGNYTSPVAVNITYPLNNQSLGISDLANGVMAINSTSDTASVDCGINDSRFSEHLNLTWQDYTFINNTYLANGWYHVSVECNSSGGTGSDSVYFEIDLIEPELTFISPSVNGTTLNPFSLINITCSDTNLLNFEGFVLRDSDSVNVLNWSYKNIAETIKYFNYSFNMSTGYYTIGANCSDGHTDNDINDLRVSKLAETIEYSIKSNTLTETLASSDYQLLSLDYERLTDRIITDISFSGIGTYTKRYACNEPFVKPLKENYQGHLVCGNIWLDVEGIGIEKVSMKKITDYIYDITITASSSNVVTKSVGLLNSESGHINFFMDNDAPNVTCSNVSAYVGSNITFSYDTEDDSLIANCSIYFNGVLNKTRYDNLTFYHVFSDNLTMNYTIECADSGNLKGTDFCYVIWPAYVEPGIYDNTIIDTTNWFNTDALDTSTTSGALMYFFLFMLMLAIVVYAEVTQIPIYFLIAGVLGMFFTFLIYTKISAIIGIGLFILSFAIMMRGIMLAR